jgi:hypothetical protein
LIGIDRVPYLESRRQGVDGLFNDEERSLLALTDPSAHQVAVATGVIENIKLLFGETQTVEAAPQ